jgi:hypothetical protein
VNDAEFRAKYLERWHEASATSRLQELTCYQWFHRIWTFQEIGLPTRATFLIGQQSIEWNALYTAFKIIEDRIGLNELKNYAFHTDRVTFLYCSYRHESFRDVLLHTRGRAASDPLDKVFALMSHPTAFDLRTGKPIIEVDYSKSLSTVNAEATVVMIRAKGDLDDLSYTSHEDFLHVDATLSWPSWVPFWHANPRMGGLLRNRPQSFTACGKYQLKDVELRMSVGGIVSPLVSGFRIDPVESCEFVDSHPGSVLNFLKRIWREIVAPAKKTIW